MKLFFAWDVYTESLRSSDGGFPGFPVAADAESIQGFPDVPDDQTEMLVLFLLQGSDQVG